MQRPESDSARLLRTLKPSATSRFNRFGPCKAESQFTHTAQGEGRLTCSACAKGAGRYANADKLQLQGEEPMCLRVAGGLLALAPRQRAVRSRCSSRTEGGS